jgi:inhibitor of cysteine peptidase
MKLLTGLAMMMFAVLAHADDPMSMNVSKDQSSFVVNLAANATTGFQWSVVEFDKDLLTLSSSVYQRPDTKLIGAGGRMLFTFSLNKGKTYPKTTDLSFKYARPWEKEDTGTVQKVTVNFIEPNGN